MDTPTQDTHADANSIVPPAESGTLFTTSGAHQLDLKLADNFLTRFRGLMLARPLQNAQGLLITRCPSVHCAFLRYPIDVVYLNRSGTITKCVPGLRPWRASISNLGRDEQGERYVRAAHTLELAAGSIEAMTIRPGDRLSHPHWDLPQAQTAPDFGKQRGSAMIEFTVVGPIITLLGLAVIQYGMLFFAKTQINYATFMAAREGATANADIDTMYTAYVRGLIPLYGGGQSPTDLANSMEKASADLGANGTGNVNIEMLNPTKGELCRLERPCSASRPAHRQPEGDTQRAASPEHQRAGSDIGTDDTGRKPYQTAHYSGLHAQSAPGQEFVWHLP